MNRVVSSLTRYVSAQGLRKKRIPRACLLLAGKKGLGMTGSVSPCSLVRPGVKEKGRQAS